MAEATFLHEGTAIAHTPSGADVAAGEVVILGTMVTVAKAAIADGVAGSVDCAGVFAFAKAAGTIAVGVKIYWDESADVATTTATSNVLIGKVTKAALTGDTVVEARLNQ